MAGSYGGSLRIRWWGSKKRVAHAERRSAGASKTWLQEFPKKPEKVAFRSISRLPSGPNFGSPNSESATADDSGRVPHDDWPVRAERGGFEPPKPVSQFNGLANRRYRPLSHLSLIAARRPDRGAKFASRKVTKSATASSIARRERSVPFHFPRLAAFEPSPGGSGTNPACGVGPKAG